MKVQPLALREPRPADITAIPGIEIVKTPLRCEICGHISEFGDRVSVVTNQHTGTDYPVCDDMLECTARYTANFKKEVHIEQT